jgi:hypothetical protein
VGFALLAVLLAGQVVGGFIAWPLRSFLATLVFLSIFALELGLAELLSGRREEAKPRSSSGGAQEGLERRSWWRKEFGG